MHEQSIIPKPLDRITHPICLIVCYFGKRPLGLQFFLASCAFNPTINFLIFSDCISPDEAPANVTVIPSTLKDIEELATQKLGLDIALNEPYKLCDFKPAYGEIFSEFLQGYSFWGMTDLDVIFGNIRSFISDDLLTNYDVINAHDKYIVGHFSLYRNTPQFTSLFRKSRDYKNVFQHPKTVSFTECGKEWKSFSRRQTQPESESKLDSMTHVINRLSSAGAVRKHFQLLVREKPQLHKTNWLLQWDNGRLIDINEMCEIMYFHFHLFKDSTTFKTPDWSSTPATFYMNSHGFFE